MIKFNKTRKNGKNRGFQGPAIYVTEEIFVTKHAIERTKQRLRISRSSDAEVTRRIIAEVRTSKIKSYQLDGTEIRTYRDVVYACKREKVDFIRERLVVKTCLLTVVGEKRNFSKTFSLDDIDYKAMGNTKNKYTAINNIL